MNMITRIITTFQKLLKKKKNQLYFSTFLTIMTEVPNFGQ